MIKSLHIENYALIRETDIAFHPGFVVITGETGAGKSIMLGALGMLLGQRADLQVPADKDRKCIVEATFDIDGLGLQPLFEENDIDYDDDVLILRRELLPSGKSRAFVNDTPASLQFLKALSPRLIDIHSQHQTLTLTEGSFQIQLLDTLASESPLSQYRQAYQHYTQLKRQLEQLTSQDEQARKEMDYNTFLFEELAEAKLQEGELEQLEEESNLLEHTEAIKMGLSAVTSLCDSDFEESALSRLLSARSQLMHIANYHPDIDELSQRMESSIIELRDILSQVASIDDRLVYSPNRQQQVSERLDLLNRLLKKHNVETVEELITIRQQLDEKLQIAGNLDEEIRRTMEQVDAAYAQMQSLAEQLTLSRRQASTLLENQVLPVLAQLGMPSAQIKVDIAPASDFGPMGNDSVTFLFNANKGLELRPIAEVASGGELSRLMLAIKSVVTERSLLPTIIFDEIDSGVSGDISVAVGFIMQSMAERMQVIAITHLPQIAAKANQHLKVAKTTESIEQVGDRTVSRIRQLASEERVNEIAIMLSSNPPTAAALQTAAELMGELQ